MSGDKRIESLNAQRRIGERCAQICPFTFIAFGQGRGNTKLQIIGTGFLQARDIGNQIGSRITEQLG